MRVCVLILANCLLSPLLLFIVALSSVFVFSLHCRGDQGVAAAAVAATDSTRSTTGSGVSAASLMSVSTDWIKLSTCCRSARTRARISSACASVFGKILCEIVSCMCNCSKKSTCASHGTRLVWKYAMYFCQAARSALRFGSGSRKKCAKATSDSEAAIVFCCCCGYTMVVDVFLACLPECRFVS